MFNLKQNLPQEKGLRDMYIPPKGKVIVACDYGQEELVALAQTCYTKYGFSVMRELINRHIDLHAMTTAYNENKVDKDIGKKIANISDEELTKLKDMLKWYKEDKVGKKRRSRSKPINFGLPGKMSDLTLYRHLRKSDVQCTPEEAAEARSNWLKLYPEMDYHFQGQKDGTIKESELKANKSKSASFDAEDDDDEDEVLFDANGSALGEADRTIQLYTRTNILGMTKARGSANACCNFDFQPVAAVANKIALWNLFYGEWKRAKENNIEVRYLLTNFIHDEVLTEVDEALADEVARHLQEVMVSSAKQIFKDVYLEAEASVMRRWSKAAEPAFDKNGKYIPYEDETIVCADCGKEFFKITAQKNQDGKLICQNCYEKIN